MVNKEHVDFVIVLIRILQIELVIFLAYFFIYLKQLQRSLHKKTVIWLFSIFLITFIYFTYYLFSNNMVKF